MKRTFVKAAALTVAGALALTSFFPSLTASAANENEVQDTSSVTQFMDCFQPMPIISELTSDCWGAEAVGPRDQKLGLEDEDMSDYCYWDGSIIHDDDTGKYYMFASRWNQAGGHWGQDGISGWQGSQAIYSVSDNLYGPYEDMGPIWPDYYDGAGHNVFALKLSENDPVYEEGYRYAISVSDTGMHGDEMNGTLHISKSLDGPWEHIGKMNIGSGEFGLSNICILVRPDGRYEAINRNGDLATADSIEGPWTVESNGLWWNVEGMPNTNIEDPVIWYSDGLYHCVANKWDAKEAYYLTSEDGLTNWVRHSGVAYTPQETFLKYTDGTENNWTKLERPNVYIEDGTLKAVTFAVIDVEKEEDFGNDDHGSKIIVVPFDGESLKEFAKTDVYKDPMSDRGGIAPVEDSNVQSWQDEEWKNYGAEHYLQLQRNTEQGLFGEGEKTNWDYDCKITFLKYDLSSFKLAEDASNLESAALSLVFESQEAGDAAENQIQAALADSDWTEGTGRESTNGNYAEDGSLVWGNQPEIFYDSENIEHTTAISEPFDMTDGVQEVKIDVTELVQTFKAGHPDEDIMTLALCETAGSRIRIGSKEGGDDLRAPRLIVNTSGAAPEDDSLTVPVSMEGVLVTDSGNYGEEYTPDKVIDNNEDTRWAGKNPTADYNGTYELTFEFPETADIQQIKVQELPGGDGNRIKAITVQTSDDGKTWEDVEKFTGLVDDERDTESLSLKESLQSRYIRLVIATKIKEENGNQISCEPNITEIEMYAVPEISLKYYGITQESVKLMWNTVSKAEGYDIYRAKAASDLSLGDMEKVNDTSVEDTSYQVTDLEAGAEYRIAVVANLPTGETIESNQVNVPTAKKMNGQSLESGENADLKMPYSSMALNMEYKGPIVSDDDWMNWCVSPVEVDGKYHLFSTRWKGDMSQWTVAGQIIHLVADDIEGPYEYVETIVSDPGQDYSDTPDPDKVITDLPGHAPHNVRIKKIDDKYALTFILQTDGLSGVKGQKIVLLTSDSVNGPWEWAGDEKGFVVEPSQDPEHWTYDSVLGVDNHDIIKIDGEYRIYFKAGLGQDSRMHYGYAYSDTLEGPYTLSDEPCLSENKGYIEDATVFEWNDSIYLLTTDNNGDNTGVLGYGVLWKSNDRGVTFKYEDAKIGFGLMKDYIKWPVTDGVDVHNGWTSKFERPAILMQDGVPAYFMGTLGMNLDGKNKSQSFLLKINLIPDESRTLTAVAGVPVSGMTGTGTKDEPEKAEIYVQADSILQSQIRSTGAKAELFSDQNFSEAADSIAVDAEKAVHVYIKVTAEDKSEAYYDITVHKETLPSGWDGVTVTDNGNYGGEFGTESLTDGDLNTRWAGKRPSDDYRGDYTLTFTSADPMEISRIKMYEYDDVNDGNRITDVIVQTSEDGEDWTDVQTFTGLKDNGRAMEELRFDQKLTAGYLRLVIKTALRDENGAQRQGEPNICEIEFYNDHQQEPDNPDQPLRITANPEDVEGAAGENAVFTVKAEGSGLSYQWQYANANSSIWRTSSMSGNDTPEITVPIASYRDGQKYRCVVTDQNGSSVTSESAAVRVVIPADTPVLVSQPEDFTGISGETAVFTVEAEGTGLSYQWQYSNAGSSVWRNSSAAGSTTAAISVEIASYRDGQKYRCVVTGASGSSVTSDAAKIIVGAAEGAPVITGQPETYEGAVGETAVFEVKASGTNLTYQWQYCNAKSNIWRASSMEGSTTARLSVPVTAGRDGQKYRCVITGGNGRIAVTETAVLTVAAE